MSQNKLKEVALWFCKNKAKAMVMYADPAKFNPEHFVNTEDMKELEKILGEDLVERVAEKHKADLF